MSTVTKTKKPARKSKSAPSKKSSPKAKKLIPAWIGSGIGKAFVRPGVDLTKPTLPPGKYL